MKVVANIKDSICSLFDVLSDENGTYRIVTPLEYSGCGDKIVIRVRPLGSSDGYQIDENGETELYASMSNGDIETETIVRWSQELELISPVRLTDDGLIAVAPNQRLITPYIFRVAEAAQQLFALATSRPARRISDFKEQVADAVKSASEALGVDYHSDHLLDISGDFIADHVIETARPLIIIAASGIQRLLEAEIIHMQYQAEKKNALVIAAVESQKAVGIKQYERANYYTGKTVTFNTPDFISLIKSNSYLN